METKPSKWYGLAFVVLLVAMLSWSEWVAIESLIYHWQERHMIKLDRLILALFQGVCLVLLVIGIVHYVRRHGRNG